MGCGGSAPKKNGDEVEVHDPAASKKAESAASKKASSPAPAVAKAAAAAVETKNEISAEQKEEEERKKKEEEERLAEEQADEERKKSELDAKFTELCTEFVDLLSTQVKGEVSLEELKTVYNDNAEKLMAIADQDENNSLSVEETKTLFLKNGEPDMELVMESIDRISMVKEIREKRKLREEKEAKMKEFEDACGAFVETIQGDLGDTITHEELQLVCKKPFEKYAGVLYEAEVRTIPGVIEAFTNGDEFETEEVMDLTECFKEIAKIRESEAAFDTELDGFFGELDGMDVSELGQYFEGASKEVFDALDANQDGVVDRAEMKPMFRQEDGYFDVVRLESVRSGLGAAVHEQHLETLRIAKEAFLEEVQALKEVLAKALSPIELDELKEVMPDSAEKYIELCAEGAEDSAFEAAFEQEDKTFDKPGLVLLKESVNSVLANRLKQFEERLVEFETKLVESWLKKLDFAALLETCPDQEENYNTIAAGEGLDADTLKGMFVVDGVPQFTAFNTVFDALTAIENKAMKKFDKRMEELIKFIDEFCNDSAMGKFKRQDVFQVYIDETRVGDFDKRWVKKMLNKPIDDLPGKPELRHLFTDKKTKEPSAKLVKGFLTALKTITDRRRLSIKQGLLLQEADYEAQLLRLCEIIDDDIKTLDNRIAVLEAIESDKVPTLIEQLKASDSGRLQLEEVKPLWMDGKDLDMVGLADFTNQVIEQIESTGATLKEDELEEVIEAATELDVPNEMVERPTTTDVHLAAEENNDAASEVKNSEEIAEATDVEVVKEAEETDALAEATDAADVKLEEKEEAEADDVAEFEEPDDAAPDANANEANPAGDAVPDTNVNEAEAEEPAEAAAEEPAEVEAVEPVADAPAQLAETEEAADEDREPEKEEDAAESVAKEEEVDAKRELDETEADPAKDEKADDPAKDDKADEFEEFEDPSVGKKKDAGEDVKKEEVVSAANPAESEKAKAADPVNKEE